MSLESRIRNKQRLGFISGLIIGISFPIGFFFSYWFGIAGLPESSLWIVYAIGRALWFLSYIIYQIGGNDIPRIVEEGFYERKKRETTSSYIE